MISDRTVVHRYSLPRDLTGEITAELIHARIRVARSESRVAALESLLDLVWQLERELRRPVTLRDLIAGADPEDQARRMRLVRALRLPAPSDRPVSPGAQECEAPSAETW